MDKHIQIVYTVSNTTFLLLVYEVCYDILPGRSQVRLLCTNMTFHLLVYEVTYILPGRSQVRLLCTNTTFHLLVYEVSYILPGRSQVRLPCTLGERPQHCNWKSYMLSWELPTVKTNLL